MIGKLKSICTLTPPYEGKIMQVVGQFSMHDQLVKNIKGCKCNLDECNI